MLANQVFVKKIAYEYFRRYRDESPVLARQYAARTIGKNKELEEAVKVEVALLIRSVLKGGK